MLALSNGHQTKKAREAWGKHHGNIPHGWEVHHKSRNRNHFAITNLVATAPLDHRHLHDQARKDALDRGRRKARPFHSFSCQWCGAEGLTSARNERRWCSRACTNAAWRNQHG